MLRMIAESSHLQIIPPEGYDKRISFHDPRIEQEASRMRRIGIRYVPSANGTRSTRALSGNIGSYAADSMVSRCGPPTPPPARAADSDTGHRYCSPRRASVRQGGFPTIGTVSEGAVFRPEPHGGKDLGGAVITMATKRA